MSSDQEKPRLPTTTTDLPTLGNMSQGAAHETDTESAASFFRSVPLFSLLDSDQVMEMMRACAIESYEAGEVLFKEDEAADAMYIIERGEVAVNKRSSGGKPVRVAYLGDGSVVGEMALIVSSPRSASVEAIASTRVYRLDGRAFDELRRQRSLAAYKILLKLLETLGDRRQRVLDRIGDIFANPSDHIESFERQARELAETIHGAQGDS